MVELLISYVQWLEHSHGFPDARVGHEEWFWCSSFMSRPDMLLLPWLQTVLFADYCFCLFGFFFFNQAVTVL